MSNKEELDKLARVHDTHKDFDGVLALYTGKVIAPQVKGKRVLEAGCSTGVITPMLLEYCQELEIVEGSTVYSKIVEEKYLGRIKMHCSLFEDFIPMNRYDVVVLSSVLHHLSNPIASLEHIREWLKTKGEIFITVPNMKSFHRELGVAMAIAKTVYDTSKRNEYGSQFGRFDRISLEKVVIEAGFEILESSGFFLKPFPHETMDKISLPENILDGLFEMGKRYPHLACQLYIKAKKI